MGFCWSEEIHDVKYARIAERDVRRGGGNREHVIPSIYISLFTGGSVSGRPLLPLPSGILEASHMETY